MYLFARPLAKGVSGSLLPVLAALVCISASAPVPLPADTPVRPVVDSVPTHETLPARGTYGVAAPARNQGSPASVLCPTGSVLFVDADAVGADDGSSWADAFTELQSALLSACPGITEIWVAEGIYYPDEGPGLTDGDRGLSFSMRDGLGIYGGFAGTETDRSQRDPEAHVTILSGDLNQDDSQQPIATDAVSNANHEENSVKVVQCLETNGCTDPTAILDGFIVTAGNADVGTFPYNAGGGLFTDDGQPTVNGVEFWGNRANSGGGAYFGGGEIYLTNVKFVGNLAILTGGGLKLDLTALGGPARLSDVEFIGNQVAGESFGLGGGLDAVLFGDGIELENVLFESNNVGLSADITAASGGGLSILGGPITIRDSRFISNTVRGNRANGAGAYLFASTAVDLITVSSSRFEGNGAFASNPATLIQSAGGGMYLRGRATSTVEKSDFIGNVALNDGAGLYLADEESVEIRESRFLGNLLVEGSRRLGAGIYAQGGFSLLNVLMAGQTGADQGGAAWGPVDREISIVNSTIVGNSATEGSPGVDGGFITIANSIFYGNDAADSKDIIGSGISVSHSLIQDGMPGGVWNALYGDDLGGNIDASPKFENPDGPDGTVGTGDDDFGLRAYSVGIDAGDNTVAALAGVTMDLAGNSRFQDDPGTVDTGTGTPPIVDMGAYERAAPDSDYGDAPSAVQSGFASSYPTLAADGGALHATGSGEPRLGDSVDIDTDGQPSADAGMTGATGDDGDGTDDEDGFEALTTLVVSAAGETLASLGVTTYGVGYLSAWIDFNRDGVWTDEAGTTGEEVISNRATGAAGSLAIASIPILLPPGASPGTTFLRIRFCSASGGCDEPTGPASDGEVEDHSVELVDGDAPYALVVNLEDLDFDEITVFGLNTCFLSAGLSVLCVPTGSMTGATINGTAGNDTFVVDFTGGSPFPNGATFNGLGQTGIPGDSMRITGGPLGTVHHRFSNANDGSIDVDGSLLTYTGLEPIADNVSATNRVFTFLSPNATELVTLGDDGTPDDGISLIDSDDGESVAFINPTSSLIINGGSGNQTFDLGLLDTSAGTLPSVSVIVNGDSGSDTFNVTPDPSGSGDYVSYTLNGGTPATCPGDVFNLAAGTTNSGLTVPSGTVTFSSAHGAIAYSGMEVLGFLASDLSVAIAFNDNPSFPGDDVELIVTVSNSALAESAQCLSLDMSSLPAVLNGTAPPLPAPTVSAGTYDAGTSVWTIASLDAGDSATFTGTYVVDTQLSGSYDLTRTVTASNTDSNPADNSVTASLTVGDVFVFPPKAHAQAVVFRTLASGLERMILGLYGGSPGINGAVWCRVPTPDGVVYTVVGQPVAYKLCSEGLPAVGGSQLPLYVNDLWLDETGAHAGRIYMTTWGGSGVYYSDDDGESWTSAEPDLGDGFGGTSGWVNVYAITPDATDGILYLSANNGRVFRTLNDGVNWQEVSGLPEGAADTPWRLLGHPSIPGTLFAGTMGKGVYVSTDYGLEWSLLNGNSTSVGPSTLVAQNAGYVFDLEMVESGAADWLFIGTSRGVWRMDYAGAQVWSELDTSQGSVTPTGVAPEVRDLAFGDLDGDTVDELYAVTWGFGVLRHLDPLAGALIPGDLAPFALRGSKVSLFGISPGGLIVAGTDDGALFEMTASSVVGGGSSVLAEAAPALPPTEYRMGINYPNPFGGQSTIPFALPESSHVRLSVFDLLGRQAAVLVDGVLPAGEHEAVFTAEGMPSGVYVYRLEVGDRAISRVLTVRR